MGCPSNLCSQQTKFGKSRFVSKMRLFFYFFMLLIRCAMKVSFCFQIWNLTNQKLFHCLHSLLECSSAFLDSLLYSYVLDVKSRLHELHKVLPDIFGSCRTVLHRVYIFSSQDLQWGASLCSITVIITSW